MSTVASLQPDPSRSPTANANLADLVRRLNARRRGKQWSARCPAHKDRNPSLSLTEQDGKILLYCHAGCTVEAICAALGIDVPDLFTDTLSRRSQPAIVETYDYTDEHGTLLYQVVRYLPKTFRQRRPDGHGAWTWNTDGVRRVLYRLPDILDSDRVIIVEGERDVETVWKMGYAGTCNVGGAGKWRPEYGDVLRGIPVAIIADADPPGLAHARDVARSLIGIAAEVKLIEALPGAKDVSEWREKGGTREQLLQLIENAPALTPADVKDRTPTKRVEGFALTPLRDLLVKADSPIEYIWHRRLVAGTVSALVSKPKVGKSTLARNLCVAIARGEEFMGLPTKKGECIYLALEEREDEVRKDFAAMGADGTEPILVHAAAAPTEGIQALCGLVRARQPCVVVIDPLFRLARVKDESAYAETYTALGPLIDVARETGTHVMLLHHSGKGRKADPIDSPLGSTAIGGAVATLLILKRTEVYRTIQSVQRVPEDMPETVLEFCPETRRLSIAGDRAEIDRRACESRIIEFLMDASEPQTQAQIRDAVEGQTRIIRAALTALADAAKVKKLGDGTKGKPFLYEFPNSGSYNIAGTSKPESEKVLQARVDVSEILVPENSNGSIPVPGSSVDETLSVSCWIHPTNKKQWWLRGGVHPVCGLCHPNPSTN